MRRLTPPAYIKYGIDQPPVSLFHMDQTLHELVQKLILTGAHLDHWRFEGSFAAGSMLTCRDAINIRLWSLDKESKDVEALVEN
jgi:hypothetical protein